MATYNKSIGYTLKHDAGARIVDGAWELLWHQGRGAYVVRPVDSDRWSEGDEYARLSEAISDLRSYARQERAARVTP